MTRNQIAAAVAAATKTAATVELVKGKGYWYFTASDVARNLFDSETILVMRLNDMPSARWVEDGVAFVSRVEADYAERVAA
jgi:hypothetical protein